MADTTTTQTGLVKNTDFAADLLLNKVMNGQLRTENGKTLTLAGRINAQKLDTSADSFNVQAENVIKASTLADATQDALTEMLSLAKAVQKAATTITDAGALAAMGAAFSQQYGALMSTAVDNFAVLGGESGVDMGLGSGTIGVGCKASDLGGFTSLTGALASMAGGSAVDATSLDDFIASLNGAIAAEATKATALSNRYDMLNDLAGSYKNASDSQVVTAGGSSTSLLNALL